VKNVKDYTCGYRAYTYDIIKKAKEKYGDKFVERRTFACMMEVLYKINLLGADFAEVPFELRYDHKEGESKMHIVKTVKDSLITAANLRIHTPK
ncbi:MAG: glycosyltransferase family 2 protein, partial [Clostridia bacterium]|nr:glycosyltransferase family 2 protein [Clostridia bacterium]